MSELSDPTAPALPADPGTAATAPVAPGPRFVHSASFAPQIDWARLALATATLIGVCASVYLALRLFRLPDAELDGFLSANNVSPELRKSMLLQLAAAIGAPLLLAAVVVARLRADGAYWLGRAADRLCPLLVSCFLPTLLNYRQWYGQPLPYLVMLLAVVLLLERLIWRALGDSDVPTVRRVSSPPTAASSSPTARWLPLSVVVVFALGYAVQASYYTIVRHRLFGSAGFDLGIFDNLMFNAMHFRPFKSTVAVPDGSYLSNHAEYGMFLFVPLYALRPAADTLLVLQSTFIGLAAIPLYFFASTQLSRPLSAAIACVYVFYAPIHGPNYYDFHWMPQSMLFFFWIFHAIATGKRASIVPLAMVICSIREDAAFGLIFTGLFLVVTGFRPLLGAILAGASGAWFLLVKFVIMPWAGPWWFADIYKDLVAAGESGYGSVIKTMLVNPNYFIRQLLNETKATYALHLLAPLLCLPVRSPALWLLMVPGFIVTLMTTGYAPTTSITFQYTTHWVPFLFAGAVIALRLRGERLGHNAVRASVAALCFGVLCHSYVFGSILQHNTFVGGFSRVQFTMSESEQKRYRDLLDAIRVIPPDASVAATELEVAHVSSRLNAYTLKVTAGNADYLLINKYHLDDDARRRVRDAFGENEYGLLQQKAEFYVFKKGHESEGTRAALAKLGMHRMRERPKHQESGSLMGPGGNCVSMDSARGTEAFVSNCEQHPEQRWLWSLADGRLKYKPKPEQCLGMPRRKNFQTLELMPCSDEASRWTFERTAIHHFSEKCVDQLWYNHNPGAPVGLWACAQNQNQVWSIDGQGSVHLDGLDSDKCWAMRAQHDGAPLELWPCDRSQAQHFEFSQNRIRFAGKCLELRPEKPPAKGKPLPSAPQNGWHMQLWPCDEANRQQEFHLSGPISQRGKCIDSLHSSVTDGSVVGVYDCIGNENQLFDLHF
ncbi:MAG TPA: DUF2079 domain-containing protein [Polyangiales bacterium]|nr:DUF2079 domain-containing protein [Polyangiales bacterium]